ncbi:TIGR04086 family membrane protein [Paenibacillus sp. GCM10027627]|uniref:TIGR04086 family membrane protein n=1 Tax=unclassified Paenibacillus TaxID=185978 RepID=UPI00363BA2F9
MSSVKPKPSPKSPLIGAPLLAGVVFSLIWLAIGALTLSLLLHFTDMKESNLASSALFIHSLSALAGGFTSGKRSEKKGWYNGGLLGLIYGIIIIIVSFLAANASISWNSVLILGAALLAGAFGGMIGVNLRK